jgi:hypothetical protein
MRKYVQYKARHSSAYETYQATCATCGLKGILYNLEASLNTIFWNVTPCSLVTEITLRRNIVSAFWRPIDMSAYLSGELFCCLYYIVYIVLFLVILSTIHNIMLQINPRLTSINPSGVLRKMLRITVDLKRRTCAILAETVSPWISIVRSQK